MAQMNEKELNRALRTGLPSGVFLLYGSDRYLVERYASVIVDRAVKGDKTFNYERVDGARIDFDHLYDSILTLPMMAVDGRLSITCSSQRRDMSWVM